MTVSVSYTQYADINRYGRIVDTQGRIPDADTPEFRFWDHLAEIELKSISFGLVHSLPKLPRICPSLERHGETSETLIPIDGDIVVVCALSRGDDAGRVDLSSLAALPVRQGQALILSPGVWHYAPMVTVREVRTFVLFEKETLQRDLVKEEGLEIFVEDRSQPHHA